MMSETAFFVKDMIGPKGAVSIAVDEAKTESADVDSHTRTSALRLHHSALGPTAGLPAPTRSCAWTTSPATRNCAIASSAPS